MKLERTRNAVSGTLVGVLFKLYQIICPFIIRTVFLHTLGVEYLGLNSLFTSIIQVLNVAELGVGSALVFSMYKPIADNDEAGINALLRLYRLYYRLIGTVVLGAGILLTPFLRHLIKGNIPDNINLYIIYYLNLFATVMSYWLFAYRNSLFNAHQRTDVISMAGIVTNTGKYLFQIIALIVLKNYYLFLMISLLTQLLNNVLIAFISLKYYPDYHPAGTVDGSFKKQINRTVMDLFCTKIGQVITNSFDTLVISTYLGLAVLAIYQNYYYIISSLIAIFTIFYKACLAGIGNSLLTESKQKNYNDFKRVSYMIFFSLNVCVSCLLCLYQPFMRIWLKDEALLLDYQYVLLLTVYFFIYEITMLLELYKNAAGNWHKDRFRPLIAAVINLIINITLVNRIGLYGIILSTIFSYLFINLPWIYIRLFNDVFSLTESKSYLPQMAKYLLLIIITSGVCQAICAMVPGGSAVMEFAVKFLICAAVSFSLFIMGTYQQEEFKLSIRLCTRMLRFHRKQPEF